tara:strand:- start:1123 stop:2052 length:930 start_codon:yes stop_codon:yes gene_type:complete
MKFFKPSFWENKFSFIALMLLPISLLLQIFLKIKRWVTKTERFNQKVICVGNIYLGGTGKTPLSIKIFNIVKNLNRKPIIIKKYYEEHLDEISMIKKYSKLSQDITRKKAISNLDIEKFDTIILDDGFQDNTIYKDLNILCFNEKQLIGNGMTIPSGPLREKLSAIKRSEIIFINGKLNDQFEKKIKNISNNLSIYYTKYKAVNFEKFKNKKLVAFAGIGNPDNFFELLESIELDINKKISFPDHYRYKKEEIDEIKKISEIDNGMLITTEKDYFRIKNLGLGEIEYLEIELEILNEKKFSEELKNYLK